MLLSMRDTPLRTALRGDTSEFLTATVHRLTFREFMIFILLHHSLRAERASEPHDRATMTPPLLLHKACRAAHKLMCDADGRTRRISTWRERERTTPSVRAPHASPPHKTNNRAGAERDPAGTPFGERRASLSSPIYMSRLGAAGREPHLWWCPLRPHTHTDGVWGVECGVWGVWGVGGGRGGSCKSSTTGRG
jgi:hypothetical protein